MIKIAVVMDPVKDINPTKDSSFAMMLEAQRRQYEIHYITANQLFCKHGKSYALTQQIKVYDQSTSWFDLSAHQTVALNEFNIILMRKDPPFDMEYIMDTYMLGQAISPTTHVINKPQALRDANEKFFTEQFPECTPENLISRNPDILKQAVIEMGSVIVKPMDGMGGDSIFKT